MDKVLIYLYIVAVFLMAGNHNPALNINFPLPMYDLGTDSAC